MWALVSAILLFAKEQGCANTQIDLIQFDILLSFMWPLVTKVNFYKLSTW